MWRSRRRKSPKSSHLDDPVPRERHRVIAFREPTMDHEIEGRSDDAGPPGGDALLLFPPSTEARLFPYLSLPMLTAYLRRAGLAVRQRDLNIELAFALFREPVLGRYLEHKLDETPSCAPLRDAYRIEMAHYLRGVCNTLRARVFDKAASIQEGGSAVRLMSHGIELLLEGSALKRAFRSLPAMGLALEAFGEPAVEDLGACALRELLAGALGERPPAIVGVSVAFFSQIWPSLLMARWIKARFPDTLVVFGGQQILLRHEAMARVPAIARYVDCLATGAGENTLVSLAQAVAGECPWSEVPSVTWLDDRAPPRMDPAPAIDTLPPPDFSDLPWRRYLMDSIQMPLITCVGCFWARCAFCSYGNRSRKLGYQQKAPEQIAAECEHIVETYGVRRINLVDEMTNLPVAIKAMRRLARRGIHIEFSVRCRFEKQLLDIGFCHELRALGCVQMAVGYETTSQRLLDKLEKGVHAADYQQIIDNLHAVGIELRLSVMGGILDETPEELAASEAFLTKNADKIGIDVMQMLIVEPGTRLSEDPARYGLALEEGAALQGNALLSYGQGRVGYRLRVMEGDPSFEERQERFLSIHHNVHPRKNDDLPPERRHPRRSAPVFALRLFPWARPLRARLDGGPPGTFLVNLLWQTFHRLPPALHTEGDTLVATDGDGAALLGRLRATGAGEPIPEQRTA
ncbi:radical SAM protein [Sorangium sp. So ce281]|uniref:B12-binding domain-containing radical SAM protein n=1 Tax=unclassified Sorangium TaxID=2621164 RepID=UPI003F5E2A73